MNKPPTPAGQALLQEQMAYYRARAGEYDEWFLRTGRYDHGPERNRAWFTEAGTVAAALAAFHPAGQVLELACGTGIWTEHLVRTATRVTAVDSAPEMLARNRARLGAAPVEYLQADLFTWQPPRQYDAVFFGFWLSHVPPERFAPFWEMVRRCLAPGGRVFFVDSLYDPTSTAHDHRLAGPEATTMQRRLNDGREFHIVKVFYRPEDLTARLGAVGWRATLHATDHYFLYGTAAPNTAATGA